MAPVTDDPLYLSHLWPLAWAVGYLALAASVLRLAPTSVMRHAAFASVNGACVFGYFFFFVSPSAAEAFAVLAAILFLHFGMLKAGPTGPWAGRWAMMVALWGPVALLAGFKIHEPIAIIGLSYTTFRMVRLTLEVDRGDVERLDAARYFGFMLYPPTFSSGPISPFGFYIASVDAPQFSRHNLVAGLERIIIGYAKLRFLAPVFNEFTIVQMLNNEIYIGFLSVFVGAIAFYIYLYLSFSGLMDVVIGASALLGLRVQENFDRPLLARNLKEFWNRWHITLSEVCRDLVFTPLSLFIVRRLGIRALLWASMIAAMVTFVVIGVWHGLAPGYALFGVLHGLGFCVLLAWEHLKRRHGAAMPQLPAWLGALAGRMLTFAYVSICLIFFALPQRSDLEKLAAALSWSWM